MLTALAVVVKFDLIFYQKLLHKQSLQRDYYFLKDEIITAILADT
jgi:hypothetical protein